MRVVIFDNPDGTITVRVPAQNPVKGSEALRREGETPDEHFERLVAGQNRKGGTRVAVIESADLPAGNSAFKAAREWNGSAVVVSMAKARVIKEVALELERAERLSVLRDLSWAAEEDSDLAEISRLLGLRRALRALDFALNNIPNAAALGVFQPPWPEDVE